MRKLLILVMLNLFITASYACNNSTINIVSQTTNPDGSITYVLDLGIDLGALDPTHYGFTLEFLSSQNTPSVVAGGFDPLITQADLSSGVSDDLTGLIGGDVNSVVGDSDWNPYDNRTNVLSYESGSIFGSASSDYSLTISVTVMGCVEDINFDSNTNAGNAACIYTVSTGQDCALCSISAVLGTQTPCVTATGQYTQEVIVTYANEPATGTIDVNGQSFVITTSPQTVTLVGLTADGNAVATTAAFSADGACTTPVNFTAPPACPCFISVALGTQTPCVTATGQYTQQVIVTYANAPATGTIDVNGQSFVITTSPQTVTLVGLTADGNAVATTAAFSADGACTTPVNFTAPPPCTVSCIISAALGTQTPCVTATGQYTQQVIVTYANAPATGTIDVNGQSFVITTSPQTVTLVGLTADGNAVATTAAFSADGACTTPVNFTAPPACPVPCAADAGTISN